MYIMADYRLEESDLVKYDKYIKTFFREMKRRINGLDRAYKTNSGIPDIVAFAIALGFKVTPAHLPKYTDGFIYIGEKKLNGYNARKVIAYTDSSNYRKETIRFIVAHELAHYIKECVETGDYELKEYKDFFYTRRTHSSTMVRPRDEQIIDYMAGILLLPEDDFIMQYNHQNSQGLTRFSIYSSLASTFDVDIGVVVNRIEELGLS